MAQTVKVTIFGTDYPLKSNDETLTRQLAQDVDSQLRELQQKLPSQSTSTLAVLTALNYAEQESHAFENHRRELEHTASTLDTLSEALEQAILG